MSTLDASTIAKASEAGELLLRAAAVLGTLSAEQQQALQQATDGAAPDSLVLALSGLRRVAPDLDKSLRAHPPRGLIVSL